VLNVVTKTGTEPIFRFFPVAYGPKTSHFYTTSTEECRIVRGNSAWQYETLANQLPLRGIDRSGVGVERLVVAPPGTGAGTTQCRTRRC